MSAMLTCILLVLKIQDEKEKVLVLKKLKDLNEKHRLMIYEEDATAIKKIVKKKRKRKKRGGWGREEKGRGREGGEGRDSICWRSSP